MLSHHWRRLFLAEKKLTVGRAQACFASSLFLMSHLKSAPIIMMHYRVDGRAVNASLRLVHLWYLIIGILSL